MKAITRKGLSSCLVFIVLLTMTAPAFAASALRVDLPIQVKETGSVAPGTMYEVVLSAEEPDYPMPVGSESGVYRMEVAPGEYRIPLVFSDVGFYYYTIEQTPIDDPLWYSPAKIYHVTVVVSYTEDWQLQSTVVMQAEGETEKCDLAVFENTWVPEGRWAPKVTKKLTGRKLEAGEFEFSLLGDKVHQIKANQADGQVIFDEIVFNKAGEYEFTLNELIGDAYAVSYDLEPQVIKLLVTDNGDGTLAFEPSYGAAGVVFENCFDMPKIDITVYKRWVGGPQPKPPIELQLYRDGKAFGDKVSLEGQTKYIWKDLDQTDQAGQAYIYSVKEVNVPQGYRVSYSKDGLRITNTWTKPTLPATGMGSSLALIIIGIGMLVVAVMLYISQRNRQK